MANKSNEKKIQPIVIEDSDRVCDIWLIGSLTSNGFIHAGFWYSLLPKIKMQFSDISRTWVYKENGIIKGFVTLGTEDGTGSNYIEELFVDLPYQRKGTDKEKGIGTQLLEYAKKDKKFLEISVYQLNTGAIIFYTKQGFKIKKNHNSIYVENKTGQWKLRMRWDKC